MRATLDPFAAPPPRLMTGHSAELRDELEKLERKHAENPEGRYFVPLANAYRKAGDVDRAVEVLRDGLDKHPDYLSAHIVLGRCLADRGEAAAAEAEFRYVLTLDGQNLIALRTLGELALGSGRIEDAQRWFRELLKVDPMNEDARRALDGIQVIPGQAEAAASPAAPELAESRAVPAWQDPLPNDAPRPSPQPVPPAPRIASDESDSDFLHPSGAPLPGGGDDEIGSDLTFGTEGQAVVTETIAELYTRQGFYSRAAEVYRELIRRKGPSAELEERLRRVEELAGAEGPERTGDRASRSDPAQDREIAEAAVDAFAASFSGGFTTLDPGESTHHPQPQDAASEGSEPLAPSAAAESDEALRGLELVDRYAMDEGAGTATFAALDLDRGYSGYDALDLDAPAAQPVEPRETIRDYLAEVFAWPRARPAGGAAAADGGGTALDAVMSPPDELDPSQARPEGWEPETFAGGATFDDDADTSADLSTSPTVSGDAFPWEIPGELPAPEPADKSASVADEPWAGGPAEGVRSGESAPSEAAPPPPGPAPTSASGADPGVGRPEGDAEAEPPAADDDDLESFQAWLRSLKR